MRKLIVVSAGLLALTAFTAMPSGNVMAQVSAPPPRPAPAKPDCLGEYLTCLGGAFQDLYCCAHPDAKECEPVMRKAAGASELMTAQSCQQLFHDDVNSCDDDFVVCVTGQGASTFGAPAQK